MPCQVCKKGEASFEAGGVQICFECKRMLVSNFLLFCTECNSMAFIRKTELNAERLMFFLPTNVEDLIFMDVIIPMRGCPNCVHVGEVVHEKMPSMSVG